MKSAQPSRLGELASEVTRKGYLGRAQQRAARRKSPWNLLDLLFGVACIGAAWWAFLHSVWAVRNLVMPQHAVSFSTVFHSHAAGLAPIIFFVAPLFAAIPVGLFLSNCIVWFIPPYRRASQREAEGVWHASFADAQKDLSLLALCMGLPVLIASFVAALFLHV
jgi:hypothetical protein